MCSSTHGISLVSIKQYLFIVIRITIEYAITTINKYKFLKNIHSCLRCGSERASDRGGWQSWTDMVSCGAPRLVENKSPSQRKNHRSDGNKLVSSYDSTHIHELWSGWGCCCGRFRRTEIRSIRGAEQSAHDKPSIILCIFWYYKIRSIFAHDLRYCVIIFFLGVGSDLWNAAPHPSLFSIHLSAWFSIYFVYLFHIMLIYLFWC